MLRVAQGHHAGRVVLTKEKPGQCAGENFGAFQFGGPGARAAILHRDAGVADDVEADIGFLHVTFDAEPIAASVEAPIEMAEVVAGLIITIVGEFDAEPMERTVMQAAEKTLHHVAGLEIQAFQSCEQFGIESLGERLGGGGHG